MLRIAQIADRLAIDVDETKYSMATERWRVCALSKNYIGTAISRDFFSLPIKVLHVATGLNPRDECDLIAGNKIRVFEVIVCIVYYQYPAWSKILIQEGYDFYKTRIRKYA